MTLAKDLHVDPMQAFRKMPFVALVYMIRAADEMARELEYKQRKEAYFERARAAFESWRMRRRYR